MDELQRYGLLSFACLVVLCLALTFKDRETQRVAREPKVAQARDANRSGDDLGKESRSSQSPGAPVIPEPHADAEGARPDDVPLRSPGAGDPKAPSDSGKKSAPEATPPKKAAEPGPASYQVAKGDTLRKIARVQLGDEKRWNEIVAANPGIKETALKVGQSLKLPQKAGQGSAPKAESGAGSVADRNSEAGKAATEKNAGPKGKTTIPKTHTVVKGETLSSIARRYYNDALVWKKIYNANKGKMKSATDVREGLVLALP